MITLLRGEFFSGQMITLPLIGVASHNEYSDKWIQRVGVNLSVASCEMYLKIGQYATDISTNQMKQKGIDLSERFGLRSCNPCEHSIWRV